MGHINTFIFSINMSQTPLPTPGSCLWVLQQYLECSDRTGADFNVLHPAETSRERQPV